MPAGHGKGGASSSGGTAGAPGHQAANRALAGPAHRKNFKAGSGRHGHPRGPAVPHPNNLPRRR